MKKLMTVLFLVAVFAVCGSVNAFAAVPTIDGSLGGGEWANITTNGKYPFYLDVIDPNESDNQIDEMDMSHVVLLQNLNYLTGEGAVDGTNDGLYLLIETYKTPSLQYPDLILNSTPPPTYEYPGVGRDGRPTIWMEGDFLNDGLDDDFNIFIRTYNSAPVTGAPAVDLTQFCFGSATQCDPYDGTVWTTLDGYVGALGGIGNEARGSVIEYFIPTGTGGTPHEPFPGSFVGDITYGNGAAGDKTTDDLVVGTLIPEPASMLLVFSGLLSLLGVKKFWA